MLGSQLMKINTIHCAVLAVGLSMWSQVSLAQNGGVTPSGLDPEHYHCYAPSETDAVRHPDPIRVELEDQFGTSSDVTVGQVAFVCAPASKNGDRLADRLTHLVCYNVDSGLPATDRVRTSNQFGDLRFTVGNSRLLCVPSLKRVIEQ